MYKTYIKINLKLVMHSVALLVQLTVFSKRPAMDNALFILFMLSLKLSDDKYVKGYS